MVALHVWQVWWTLAYKPQRTRRHKSRRTLCQGRSVRACVHSVGMLCGYMPNSSLHFVVIFFSIFFPMKTANQGGNDILWDFVLKTGGTNFLWNLLCISKMYNNCITACKIVQQKHNTITQTNVFFHKHFLFPPLSPKIWKNVKNTYIITWKTDWKNTSLNSLAFWWLAA